jgi:GTPase KRas protein
VYCQTDRVHDREVPREDGAALAAQWGVPFFETSALLGENITEAMFELVRQIPRARSAEYKRACSLIYSIVSLN